ncbi:MAG: hypothetical protein E7606_02535 [Ruminococcaceae bacterium]|nr:hypothetical protein [Oscillospiraceae bacterium]
MLHLIYGLSGTGKTSHLIEKIKEDIKMGKKAFLIVPEQQTVEIERIMASILPPTSQLSFEVVNFTRLANKLFRIYGGLSYHYMSAGLKELFIWHTLKTLAPFLKEYDGKKAADDTLPSAILAAIGELKAYDVSPVKLERAAKAIPEGKALKNKLTDLSLIYSAYEGLVKEAYDDSSDDLGKLADLLETKNYFAGYNVYIDSFIDFTAQEYRILKCLLAQADDLFVTLLADRPDAKDVFLSSVKETSCRLRALAGENFEITVLEDFHRFASPDLCTIARDLWHFHVKGEPEEEKTENRALSLVHCHDAYGEAKAAAAEILSLVQDHGYRFREIAVIARNAESYRGVLNIELEKAGIPFFMSDKTDIATKPLISMIFSVLAIKQKNYRATDVITYIKTGLSGFTPYEMDILETYTSTWRIHGKQFTDGDWEMNPDGYSEVVSARGKVILDTANSVRVRLVGSLSPFFAELDKAKTLSDFCNALYRFLKNSSVAERLAAYAARALEEGDKKEAAETASIFKAVFGVLTDMVAALGDEEIELEDFVSALRIVLGKTELGTIPTAADEVMIGSASMLRASGIRCAILIGLCEGEFPMRISEKGLFTDTDRSVLEELGISLSGNSAADAANELLYVYRAMTMPSERLVLTYRDKQLSGRGSSAPSLAFRRISELFPKLKTVSFDTLSVDKRIFDKANALEALPTLRASDGYPSLHRLLSEDTEYQNRMAILDASVSEPYCRLEEGTVDMLFGDAMTLTQSKIEKYVSCHFSYYCNYVLRLRETKRAAFDYANIGTFIHKVLEIFLKETGKETIDVDRDIDKIRAIIHRLISEQSHLFVPKSKESEGRILHLLLRFYRLASLVAVNICREKKYSKFVAKLYETEFGTGSKLGLEAPTIHLSDGSTVSFDGKVDRVDTYHKDGKMYIRVIDYKTGQKSFSLKDIKEGYNIQLLLYLFAICDTRSDYFRRIIGCEVGDVLSPAGALYLSMAVPNLSRKVGDTDEKTLEAASGQLKRSGFLLKDDDTLHAMSETMDPNMLAGVHVSKKDGTLTGDALVDEEGFMLLKQELGQTICRIADEMKSGNADASPNTHDGKLACIYCEMKPFCRVDKLKASEKKTKEEAK